MTEITNKGHFTKGDSRINRNGRPKSITTEIRAAFDEHREELINQCVEQAKAGDAAMLTLALKYCSPTPQHRAIQLDIPEDATIKQKLAVVSEAVVNGEISPNESKLLSETFLSEFNFLELERLTEENRMLSERLKR